MRQLQPRLGRIRVAQPREHGRVNPRAAVVLVVVVFLPASAGAAAIDAVVEGASWAAGQQSPRDHLAVRHHHLSALAVEEPAHQSPR